MSDNPLPPGMLEFLNEYHRIEDDLVTLLNIDLQNDRAPDPMEVRLAKRYDTIREMAMAEDIRAGLRLARLGMLVENLRTLKTHHPTIFSDFKAAFHEIEHDRYFGWRCEVDTAAFLTNNGVEFAHPDPPDFKIEWLEELISIECTSAHYRGSTAGIEDKIKDTLSKKANKDYIKPSTALFIDVTNVYHTAVARGEEFGSNELKRWVRERIALEDLDIGSVLLLAYIGEMDDFRLQQSIDRVDNSPNEPLFDFLEEHVPFGEGARKVRWFPPEP